MYHRLNEMRRNDDDESAKVGIIIFSTINCLKGFVFSINTEQHNADNLLWKP
ncbi:MAG: hypothetical protein JWR18_1258 [Segetibacter sp.]|jgi:hypothetical protein|nr:hypothetical protein [Segetibacter sp.]